LLSPFAFSGVPLFSSDVFFVKPLCVFGGDSFFTRGLFVKPMNEGSDSTPLFMASRVCIETLVELGANLVSWFDFIMTQFFWGVKLY
jgi:hypothetical protein